MTRGPKQVVLAENEGNHVNANIFIVSQLENLILEHTLLNYYIPVQSLLGVV